MIFDQINSLLFGLNLQKNFRKPATIFLLNENPYLILILKKITLKFGI